jgi:FKBP-type peptidyl-prolyl cis-trans isomerase FkpA
MKKFLILAALLSSSAFAQIATPVSAKGGGKVEVLTNGVRVTHLVPGNGVSPNENSTVQVTYKGTFMDGRVFDASSQPIEFGLKRVVLCWTTGIQKLKVGETAKLECPAETAYGSRGAPGVIPPNTPLIFEVKLLAVK